MLKEYKTRFIIRKQMNDFESFKLNRKIENKLSILGVKSRAEL